MFSENKKKKRRMIFLDKSRKHNIEKFCNIIQSTRNHLLQSYSPLKIFYNVNKQNKIIELAKKMLDTIDTIGSDVHCGSTTSIEGGGSSLVTSDWLRLFSVAESTTIVTEDLLDGLAGLRAVFGLVVEKHAAAI